jgi:hypothetical protein
MGTITAFVKRHPPVVFFSCQDGGVFSGVIILVVDVALWELRRSLLARPRGPVVGLNVYPTV